MAGFSNDKNWFDNDDDEFVVPDHIQDLLNEVHNTKPQDISQTEENLPPLSQRSEDKIVTFEESEKDIFIIPSQSQEPQGLRIEDSHPQRDKPQGLRIEDSQPENTAQNPQFPIQNPISEIKVDTTTITVDDQQNPPESITRQDITFIPPAEEVREESLRTESQGFRPQGSQPQGFRPEQPQSQGAQGFRPEQPQSQGAQGFRPEQPQSQGAQGFRPEQPQPEWPQPQDDSSVRNNQTIFVTSLPDEKKNPEFTPPIPQPPAPHEASEEEESPDLGFSSLPPRKSDSIFDKPPEPHHAPSGAPHIKLPKKKNLRPLKKIMAILAFGIIGVSSLYYGFKLYSDQSGGTKVLGTTSQSPIENTVKAVGAIVELSSPDEQPTEIANVDDVSKLSNNAFFDRAENGDVILIYSASKVAVLFRPTTGKVIAIGPVDMSAAPSPTATPAPSEDKIVAPSNTPSPTKAAGNSSATVTPTGSPAQSN